MRSIHGLKGHREADRTTRWGNPARCKAHTTLLGGVMSEPVRGTDQSGGDDVLEALNETYSVLDTVDRASKGTSPPPPHPQRGEPTQDEVEGFPVDLENFAIDLDVELSGLESAVRAPSPSKSMEGRETALLSGEVQDVPTVPRREGRSDEGEGVDGSSPRLRETSTKDEGWGEIWSSSNRQPALPGYRSRRGPLSRLRRRLKRRRFRGVYLWWASDD
jgi:hypothetical protein